MAVIVNEVSNPLLTNSKRYGCVSQRNNASVHYDSRLKKKLAGYYAISANMDALIRIQRSIYSRGKVMLIITDLSKFPDQEL